MGKYDDSWKYSSGGSWGGSVGHVGGFGGVSSGGVVGVRKFSVKALQILCYLRHFYRCVCVCVCVRVRVPFFFSYVLSFISILERICY